MTLFIFNPGISVVFESLCQNAFLSELELNPDIDRSRQCCFPEARSIRCRANCFLISLLFYRCLLSPMSFVVALTPPCDNECNLRKIVS